jgi:hypothetical protein
LRPEFHLFWTVHNCMSLRKLASREGHTVNNRSDKDI